jgi:hypothetical protein
LLTGCSQYDEQKQLVEFFSEKKYSKDKQQQKEEGMYV